MGYGRIDAFASLSKPIHNHFIRIDLNPIISSDHPYYDDSNRVRTIYEPNADSIRVHFSAFNLTEDGDCVSFMDSNDTIYSKAYRGNLGSFTSIIIPGNTIKVKLVTNSSGTEYGFDIDYYEYTKIGRRNIYVDIEATGENNGTSWQDAFTGIQQGINDTNTGDTVWVAEGEYIENINFNGKSITLLSLDGAEKTTINGNGNGTVIHFGYEGDDYAFLSGFTITGGGNVTYGGGIYCYYGSPTITNCTISGNLASYYGGGILCSDSSAEVTNCTITNNSAYYYGGGIYGHYYTTSIITNCTISENSAGSGAGIYCDNDSPLTILNCTITRNLATNLGGGLRCISSSPLVKNCIFWNNTPQELYIDSGAPTITYSDIKGGYGDPNITHNINADPQLVNPSIGDYRLNDNSPCIDAGTNEDAPSTDKVGSLRPGGVTCDMGAYESFTLHIYPGDSIQEAIDHADNGMTIIVYPGEYFERINFIGKRITVRSTDPDDPNIVHATIINGNGSGSVVTFNHNTRE